MSRARCSPPRRPLYRLADVIEAEYLARQAAIRTSGTDKRARRVIADCEAALEIIDETGTRLAHALNCLRKVPDDLAGTYEVPYGHIRDGGKLPHYGEFLTGTTAA